MDQVQDFSATAILVWKVVMLVMFAGGLTAAGLLVLIRRDGSLVPARYKAEFNIGLGLSTSFCIAVALVIWTALPAAN